MKSLVVLKPQIWETSGSRDKGQKGHKGQKGQKGQKWAGQLRESGPKKAFYSISLIWFSSAFDI